VELERGVEGLIHISEMSWTRHIKHPSKVVSIGDEVDVMVLKIDKENEKISLGLKQCESDPWVTLIERYPVGSEIEGKVRNLTDFGAFVEVEDGIDGLVHISDMSWTRRVRHPKEMLKRGDSVQVQILDIDTSKRRISLGIKQMSENPWPVLAEEYPVGHTLEGNISRMLDHGVIVEMGEDLEGFVPIGHLGIPKLDKPQYYFREGETADLKVIKMDIENRRIVLSIAERLKDFDEDATEKFITTHPRLEDVVAAEAAAEAEGASQDGSGHGDEDYQDQGDSMFAETESSPVEETVATAEPAPEVEEDAVAASDEAEEAVAEEPAAEEPEVEEAGDDEEEAEKEK
jgi:small subunit ribosomal protein S1